MRYRLRLSKISHSFQTVTSLTFLTMNKINDGFLHSHISSGIAPLSRKRRSMKYFLCSKDWRDQVIQSPENLTLHHSSSEKKEMFVIKSFILCSNSVICFMSGDFIKQPEFCWKTKSLTTDVKHYKMWEQEDKQWSSILRLNIPISNESMTECPQSTLISTIVNTKSFSSR